MFRTRGTHVLLLLAVGCALLAVPSVALAAGPGFFGNANCLACHAAQQPFDVPPVDRDTACPACHATGLFGAHPYHQLGANCGAMCHPGWGETLLCAVPTHLDPASGGAFASALSKNAPSSIIHVIHSEARWPGRIDTASSACSSCHAVAACTACHVGEVAGRHATHGASEYEPWTGTVGYGVPGGDQTVRTSAQVTLQCATGECHDIQTTSERRPALREDFPHRTGENASDPWITGTWYTRANSLRTGGRNSLSSQAGATLSIAFSGELVELVTDKDPYRGIAQILIDGELAATVDLYSPTTVCQSVVFDSGRLDAGQHTLTVRVTGTKNPSSRHTLVTVDCFRVYGTVPGSVAPSCTEGCHPDPHDVPAIHTGAPADEYVLVYAEGEHDSEMRWDGVVMVSCGMCHATELGAAHGQECLTCHVAPADSLETWAGGCQEGDCHPAYHDDASAAHQPVSDQCDDCHDLSFAVTAAACPNCHAVFNTGDSLPPVTTSDAQPGYVGAARIRFSVTDGGKVAVATTYHRLNGGALRAGSSMWVDQPGAYTLEFWSVDQAGNIESPNTVVFTIATDATPPVTTSNAQSAYYAPATITLTATDNGSTGVKATYYTLNSGPVETGTRISIPQPASGTDSYTLEFWSEDWSGNVEAPNTVSFTVTGGEGTIRLVWGDCDITGDPPPDGAYAYWYIRRGSSTGTIVHSGSGSMPGWSGVDDIVLPVSGTAYYVDIWWYYPPNGWEDNTVFPDVHISEHGDLVRLSY